MTEHLLLSLPGVLIGADLYALHMFFFPVPDDGFSFPPCQATTTMPGIQRPYWRLCPYSSPHPVRRNRGKIDATTDWVPPDGGGEINIF